MLLGLAGVAALQSAAQAGPQQVSQPKYKMVVEKDVRIPTRDGSYLAADVYHPDAPGEKFPVLMSLSAYQKELQFLPPVAPFTHQERPEPEWWVSRGYTPIRRYQGNGPIAGERGHLVEAGSLRLLRRD